MQLEPRLVVESLVQAGLCIMYGSRGAARRALQRRGEASQAAVSSVCPVKEDQLLTAAYACKAQRDTQGSWQVSVEPSPLPQPSPRFKDLFFSSFPGCSPVGQRDQHREGPLAPPGSLPEQRDQRLRSAASWGFGGASSLRSGPRSLHRKLWRSLKLLPPGTISTEPRLSQGLSGTNPSLPHAATARAHPTLTAKRGRGTEHGIGVSRLARGIRSFCLTLSGSTTQATSLQGNRDETFHPLSDLLVAVSQTCGRGSPCSTSSFPFNLGLQTITRHGLHVDDVLWQPLPTSGSHLLWQERAGVQIDLQLHSTMIIGARLTPAEVWTPSPR